MNLDDEGLDPALSRLVRRARAQPTDWRLLLLLQEDLSSAGHGPRAAQVLEHLEETFENVPAVLAHVGAERSRHEDPEERARGLKLLERSLSLLPSNDSARRTLFERYLEGKDWEGAEALLDRGGPELRERLVQALEANGQGGEADRLRGPASPPSGARNKVEPLRAAWLRRAPRKPRPSLDEESQDPEDRVSPLRVIMGLGAIVVVGLLFASLLRADDQPLYLVNGTGRQATVTISGEGEEAKTQVVPPGKVVPVRLGEGRYQVRVEHRWGKAEHDLLMKTGISGRVGKARTIFVLNVAGAGAILREEEQYRDVLQPSTKEWEESGKAHLLSGAPLVKIEGVHFPFQPWPARIPGGSPGGRTDRTRVSLLTGIPVDVLADLPAKVPGEEVLNYLESQLRIESRVSTYDEYERVAKRERALARREAFLRSLSRPDNPQK